MRFLDSTTVKGNVAFGVNPCGKTQVSGLFDREAKL